MRVNRVVIAIILAAGFLVASSLHAQAPTITDVISGSGPPLSLKLKELDSTWRVIATEPPTGIDQMVSGQSSVYFTHGQLLTVGGDQFLVAYSLPQPAIPQMYGGGTAVEVTADTPLHLSLINMGTVGGLYEIRPFDLKDVIASSQPQTPRMPAEKPLLANGVVAPNFTVHDRRGNPVRLSDYKGKVVVLDFWATWCGPCQKSLPSTNNVGRRFRSKNVVILGVNVWDTRDAFQAWLPKHKQFDAIKFAIDPTTALKDVASTLYNVSGIPTQYVIGVDGKIVASNDGFSGDDSQLTAGIEKALAGSSH